MIILSNSKSFVSILKIILLQKKTKSVVANGITSTEPPPLVPISQSTGMQNICASPLVVFF